MAGSNPRNELAAAQAQLESIEVNIAVKQAECQAATGKNDRAALRLEVQSIERQKAAATRRLKAAQVRIRKAELASAGSGSPEEQMGAPDNDWAEHIDAQTGNRFYYNRKTGESSWTQPAPASQSVHASSIASHDAPPIGAAIVEEWTEHVDPQSGQTFYYNATTGETSWTKVEIRPVLQEQQSAQPPAQCPLDADWTEHVDPASGNIFYYHTKTGETSWTRPESVLKALETQQSACLGNEWTETFDQSSGQKFYYNVGTGESSWTNPSAVSALQLNFAIAA